MSKLQKAFNPSDFRKNGHQLIDTIADYLEEVNQAKIPVMDWRQPDEALEDWNQYISNNNTSTDFYKKIIKHSMHLHHPKYMGHQVAPPLPDAMLSGLLVSALKNGSGLYEMSPLSAPMEKIVIDFFSKHIGYENEASGFLTSGGTLANLTALLTARQVKGFGDIWNEGNPEEKQLAIMVSEEAHYCVDRAVRIMGLGEAGIVKIPTNEKYQADISQLEEVYNNAITEGKIIFAIVGNACSTSVGAYDNLEAFGAFAQKHDLWFHADGAHGGAAIFSEKYKPLVKGIEHADSVIIDGHKMMMTAGLITALIYKNGKDSYRTFHQKAHYLWENSEEEWFNLTKRTFECTKFNSVLEVYSLIKNYDVEIFDQYVTYTYDLARAFSEILKVNSNFEIAHEPESNILCFRVFKNGNTPTELNELNTKIRKQLLHDGKFYIVQTILNDSIYLRVTLMNSFSTIEMLEELIEEISNLSN
ncbi:MAG: aspartate aminotransferase family protein [Saprospiraceae bacterium]